VKIILAVILVLIIANGCETKEQAEKQKVITHATVNEGKQYITLSWGKYNYKPEVIVAKKDMPLVVEADLNRLTGCFTSFVVPAFKVNDVFTRSDNTVEFTPTRSGNFTFTCAMGMGKGQLVVE
jgi:plastocyanin domain-containing protein